MVEDEAKSLKDITATAHLMMEAVDKASQDLEATVKLSVDRMRAFNENLSKNFVQQLGKMAEDAVKAVDKGSEELQARKENFSERLVELEQIEIETIVRTGREVRQELDLSLRNAITLISQLVEEQTKTLHPIVTSKHENFLQLVENETGVLSKFSEESKNSLKDKRTVFERDLSNSIGELDQSVKTLLDQTREKHFGEIKTHQTQLEEKIDQTQTKLNEFASSQQKELEERMQTGRSSLSAAGNKVIKRLADEIADWKAEVEQMTRDFYELLTVNKDSFEQIHKTKVERQVQEVREEIGTISAEAKGRLSASHKLFQGSLKRLEKKYHERLERLLHQFEAAVAQENQAMVGLKIFRSNAETSHELKELLNTRLKARGLEIVKNFKRQIDLFDIEQARFSANCSERVETVYAAAQGSLEQHVKTMNAEIERALRSFRVELSQLNLQLPQIKDAGHSAALAVTAYKRARLSFGTD